jgi:hypothetical protein
MHTSFLNAYVFLKENFNTHYKVVSGTTLTTIAKVLMITNPTRNIIHVSYQLILTEPYKVITIVSPFYKLRNKLTQYSSAS